MEILYEKAAAKHIAALDHDTKQRIRNAIRKIPDGDIKKLKGYKNEFRLRVGDMRVLFSLLPDLIIIRDVLPRGSAYKRL